MLDILRKFFRFCDERERKEFYISIGLGVAAEGNFPLPFSSVLESTSLLVESNFKLQLFMSRSVFYI